MHFPKLFRAAIAASALAWAGSASAQAYPDHPITIVVTFPPGGGTDLLARKLAAGLEQRLGQAVVVDNRPGASGNIGARAVARARPDGHTLLMVNSSFAINPGVFRELDFSPKDDFAAVANVAYVPSVIAVPAASPLRTLDDALHGAAGAEGPLAYASCGNGTPQHLAGEMLQGIGGARLQHVPYRGCGPALTALVAGQVPMGIITASSAAPFLRDGRLRALAVTSPQRSPVLPGVPTVAEQGVPGYELDQWHGLLAPAGTPADVVEELNTTIGELVAQPAMQQALRELGYTPAREDAQSFHRLVLRDIERFGAVTARIGLQVD